MRSLLPALGFALLLSACPRPSVVEDAGVPDAGLTETVVDAGPVDAGPVTLDPAVFEEVDGGLVPLRSGEPAAVTRRLEVHLPAPLLDYRLRLLDWRDQVVVSDDSLLEDGTTYVFALAEPLRSGRSYTLSLEAEVGPSVTDEAHRAVADWELAFRVEGDVEPEPVPAKKRKRH